MCVASMGKSILSYPRMAALACGLTRLGCTDLSSLPTCRADFGPADSIDPRSAACTSVSSRAASSSSADYLCHSQLCGGFSTASVSCGSEVESAAVASSCSSRDTALLSTLTWHKLSLFMLLDRWWQPLSCQRMRKQSLLLRPPTEERFPSLNKLVCY